LVTVRGRSNIVPDTYRPKDRPMRAAQNNHSSDDAPETPLKRKKGNDFVDDEAEDDDSTRPGTSFTAIDGLTPSPARGGAIDGKDDDNDDASAGGYSYNGNYEGSGSPHTMGNRPVVAMPDPQPAFAPSSTPLDLPRRFLCWNHVGSAALQTQDGRRVVDITFTDSAFRRPITFTDTMGFILGTLGEDGGFFATDLADDGDDSDVEDEELDAVVNHLSRAARDAVRKSRRTRKIRNNKGQPMGSSLYFHRFETFAAAREKDWCIVLPTGERALGCATGEGWAAVVTR
jgi:Minichromosome loss protein, Mcl1, middle region